MKKVVSSGNKRNDTSIFVCQEADKSARRSLRRSAMEHVAANNNHPSQISERIGDKSWQSRSKEGSELAFW